MQVERDFQEDNKLGERKIPRAFPGNLPPIIHTIRYFLYNGIDDNHHLHSMKL